MLDLANPIYEKTATFGHFGRKSNEGNYFTWKNLIKFRIGFIIIEKNFKYYGRRKSKLSSRKNLFRKSFPS